MMIEPTIEFASLGMADSLILMVLALVVFGPRRLPQIGRQIGKLMYEFRKASNDFKFQMEEELRSAEDADRRKKEEERLRTMALAAPAEPAQTIEDGTTPIPIESPYPEEIQYPELTSGAVQTPPEDNSPRIQPPSTGEQVGASPPNSAAVEPEFHSAAEQAWEEAAVSAVSDSTVSDSTTPAPASPASVGQGLSPEISSTPPTGVLAPEVSASEHSPDLEPGSNSESSSDVPPEQPVSAPEQAAHHG